MHIFYLLTYFLTDLVLSYQPNCNLERSEWVCQISGRLLLNSVIVITIEPIWWLLSLWQWAQPYRDRGMPLFQNFFSSLLESFLYVYEFASRNTNFWIESISFWGKLKDDIEILTFTFPLLEICCCLSENNATFYSNFSNPQCCCLKQITVISKPLACLLCPCGFLVYEWLSPRPAYCRIVCSSRWSGFYTSGRWSIGHNCSRERLK